MDNEYAIQANVTEGVAQVAEHLVGYMGTLEGLVTTKKGNLVEAINEIDGKISGIGTATSVLDSEGTIIAIDNSTFTANFVLAANGDASKTQWVALPSEAGGVVKTVDIINGLTFNGSTGALGSAPIGDAKLIKTIAITDTVVADKQILQYNDTDKKWDFIDLPTGTAYTGTNPIDVTGSVISFKADTVEFKNDADKGLQLNDISNGQVSWTDPNR